MKNYNSDLKDFMESDPFILDEYISHLKDDCKTYNFTPTEEAMFIHNAKYNYSLFSYYMPVEAQLFKESVEFIDRLLED